MATLKYYDTATSEWKTLIVGAKGEKGDTGDQGETGLTGPQGPEGLGSVSVTAPITNSGTSTEANIGIDLTDIAPIDSPTFTGTVTGTPTTPNQSDTKSSSQIGYIGVPFSTAATTGSYTVSYNDAGRLVHSTSSRTITLGDYFMGETIEPGTTVIFSTAPGVTVTFTGYLTWVGSGSTTNRTLAPFGLATAIFINESAGWYISGNGLS
jgi:hypothetical protein